jgi:uncharacterized protein (TIGR03437 family)
MFRTGLIVATCFFSSAFAQPQPVTVTSAASASAGLAPESLATVSGENLATGTVSIPRPPWPTAAGGVTVQVTDSASVTRAAGLLLVSSAQINFEIPAGTAPGPATVLINNGGAPVSVPVRIEATAPALFSVNELGLAAATAISLVIPTRIQSPVPVVECAATPASCRLTPISLGVDTPIYLTFYGTGIRGRSSLENVTVTIGTVDIAPTYAGPQPGTPGLDQVNVPLFLSLRGAGEVSVTVTVDGVKSNPVKINVL